MIPSTFLISPSIKEGIHFWDGTQHFLVDFGVTPLFQLKEACWIGRRTLASAINSFLFLLQLKFNYSLQMHSWRVLLPAVAVVVALFAIEYCDAECCAANFAGFCGDETKGTPCCAHGRCNIFCCNCDGGCRRLASGSSTSGSPQAVFNRADLNSDGRLDLEETAAWLRSTGKDVTDLKIEFFRLDKDNDGYLSILEIDS